MVLQITPRPDARLRKWSPNSGRPGDANIPLERCRCLGSIDPDEGRCRVVLAIPTFAEQRCLLRLSKGCEQFLDRPGVAVPGASAHVGQLAVILGGRFEILERVESPLVADTAKGIVQGAGRRLVNVALEAPLNQF